GEVATYLERAGAGDEFRSNGELIERWLDEAGAVDREAMAGKDLATLLMPSSERALALAKAYLLIVREQSFARGRDAVLAPAANVHRQIDDESTGLSEAGAIRTDGFLQLHWVP
ncbi:MAG: hypothetical protein KC431_05915, partial [Myxococcales bacterium]|nr:hypothetical protein [Myxococcales bacterium]